MKYEERGEDPVALTVKKEVLLDIDGVLHPLGRVAEPGRIVNFQGWQSTYIPERLDSIVHYMLTRRTKWISTWENISNEISKSYNLPSLEYLVLGAYKENASWLKESAILDYVNSKKFTKFLIIDDELPEDSALRSHGRVKIIVPDGLLGLSEDEIALIKNFY